MSAGPIVGGIGLLLMIRVSADANYLTEVFPAVLVFGLGLAATVAPLTATVLDSVAENRVGIASGVNNGVSRVAGLLAIAVLGAVISAHFGASLDSELARASAQRRRREVRRPTPRRSRWASPRPASSPRPKRSGSRDASVDGLDLRLPPRRRLSPAS